MTTQNEQPPVDEQAMMSEIERMFKTDLRAVLLGDMSFWEMWQKVADGLKMPPDTREYKYAKMQIVRLWAPASGLMFTILLALILAFVQTDRPPVDVVTAEVAIEPEKTEKLDDIKEIKEEYKEEEPPPVDEIVESMVEGPPGPPSETPMPGPPGASQFSPKPAEFDSVAIIRSPITMRGIYGSRSPGARGGALKGYGGGSATEAAVLRALRWLKKNQQQDGSWTSCRPAMTGLALLAFLAHGETPSSEEFGYCVEAGLKYLVDIQTDEGRFKGSDGHEYALPIAAYALSEGYGLTRIMDLKYAAEKSINLIIKNQHAYGGWNYNVDQADRNDTSYMGWCAQALKAAKMAPLDCPGLDKACKNAITGFKKNFSGSYEMGHFGYTGPTDQSAGLTSVGTLCMQLMGASKSDEVMGGLAYMGTERWMKYDLDSPAPGPQGLYYWYYATQAKFHAGGDTWNKWNKLFSPELVRKQHVITKDQSGYVDHKGVPKDIGYWDQYKGHGSDNGAVFATLLGVLQLEVYYRYLPTFKTLTDDAGPVAAAGDKKKDAKKEVNIDVNF